MLTPALIWMACAQWPEQPPPAPRDPPSVDTVSEEAAAEALSTDPNRPPRLTTLALQPPGATTLDPVRVVVEAEDPDGDRVSIRVRWLVNGQPLPGESSRSLAPGRARKGQELVVEATLSDGRQSVTELSIPLVVANAPPVFLTRPEELRGALDGVQLRAEDPDGDTLSYRIENGPEGLSVDNKGRVRFVGVEGGEGGRFDATLKVIDSAGDWAGLPLTLTLTPGRPAGAP